MQLPNQSKNWLFLRQDKQVVMVIWNELPAEEVLYLGDNIERYDVWGKSQPLQQREHRQVVPVGPQPTFILGVNEAVARWRMAVHFEKDAIPSVFGVEHANALNFHNSFPMGVGGTVSLFVPNMLKRAGQSSEEPSKEWKIYPEVEEIKSAAGLDIRHTIQIELNEAAFGLQPIRIDFDLNNHKYKFSVWRSLQVGLGDIDIQAITFLDKDGRLVVQQKMVNLSGKPADFKCILSAYLRPRKRTQVFQLGPEPDLKSYAYSRGKELIGEELKLQIEEIDGDRVLIYRFLAKPESDIRFEEPDTGRSLYYRRP